MLNRKLVAKEIVKRRGLPAGPLLLLLERKYPDLHYDNPCNRFHASVAKILAELTGLTPRTILRIMSGKHTTLAPSTVDRICIRLGEHPALIYGRLWTHRVCVSCERELPLCCFSLKKTRGHYWKISIKCSFCSGERRKPCEDCPEKEE